MFACFHGTTEHCRRVEKNEPYEGERKKEGERESMNVEIREEIGLACECVV